MQYLVSRSGKPCTNNANVKFANVRQVHQLASWYSFSSSRHLARRIKATWDVSSQKRRDTSRERNFPHRNPCFVGLIAMQARWRNTVLNGIIQRLREGCDLTRLNEVQTELIKFAVSRQRRGGEKDKGWRRRGTSKSERDEAKKLYNEKKCACRLGKGKVKYKVRYFIRRD